MRREKVLAVFTTFPIGRVKYYKIILILFVLMTDSTSGKSNSQMKERTTTSRSHHCSVSQPGILIFHKKNDKIPYSWFSYVPEKLNKKEWSTVWITGLHGNFVTDDYDEITKESRDKAENRMKWAEEHKLIMCVPVIPRPRSNHVYTVALPAKVFLSDTDLFCRRPDLKVNLMVDELIEGLREEGYNVCDKVFINGHSAGAMFAQRYALLHPARVLAVAAGQCGGSLTLPMESYEGIRLNWPVGIHNFTNLTGNEFDFTSYQKLEQFIYIGETDSTHSTLVRTGELWNTQSQIDFLNDTFGDTDPVRLKKQTEFLVDLGCKITFKLYPGVGHQRTSRMYDDIFLFFNKIIKSER